MSHAEWAGRHQDKDGLRERIWRELVAQGASPKDPFGHIPDFYGSDRAAALLATLPVWQRSRVIKANPDTAQAPVRLRALQEGRMVYMAVPRLIDDRCFVALVAAELQAQGVALEHAATWQGALEHGRLVAFEAMEPIDLVVTGCVAVSRGGGRTGKGAGFADIELGMLREWRLVGPGVPIITTVHAIQLVDDGDVPMMPHDSALDWIITPDEAIETHTRYPQPRGIAWDAVQPDQYESIPALRSMRARRPV